MTPEAMFLFCPACDRECLGETPPCADGHGAQCPDRACVECGTALMFDAQLIQLAVPTARSARRAA